MAVKNDTSFQFLDGIYISPLTSQKFSDFEKNYLTLREKEKRVLSHEEVRQLPFVDKNSPDYELWKIRRKNISRFLNFLSGKNKKLNILDLGCGNGFFSNLMALKGHNVTGVDVNLLELKQAAAVFKSSGINWYYLDILQEEIPNQKFDLITFCCSFQYFKKPAELLKRCHDLLSDSGEIHIIDSPFYNEKTQETARVNSLKHFRSLGIESMSDYYNHYTYEVLKEYKYSFKYNPRRLLNKLLRIKDSPFPWISISKIV